MEVIQMATHIISERTTVIPTARESYKAYKILKFAFVAALLIAGIDKFLNMLVHWEIYLSPMVSRMIDPNLFMRLVGVIEIAAAVLVVVNPRIGGMVVAFWLWGIILNLLSIPAFYDIALRDFGLSLGALALSFLSKDYAHGNTALEGGSLET
jgi:hypothetical protein